MNVKVNKLKTNIKIKLVILKKRARAAWYATMKPVARLADKVNSAKYAKLKRKCQEISDEDLMYRYAKYIVNSMINSRSEHGKTKRFIVFHKSASKFHSEDFSERILFGLRNINYDCRDKVLLNWHFHNANSKRYYELDNIELIRYEIKLNTILKEQLEKLGVSAEYEDERESEYRGKHYKYDFYGKWLNKIGYEKTLVIKVKT